MILYSREQESFEEFCRNEFKNLFGQTSLAVTSALKVIDQVQKPKLSSPGDATTVNSQFASIEYSYFSGGKRFRPMLSFAGAQYLDLTIPTVFPWAMAIEMIHTYSLIHDDLPCMDNDDLRRGKPTNHKVYGEPIALLAGDSLVTEAFGVVAKHYGSSATTLSGLIYQLCRVSGLNGMILGQYYDMTLEAGKMDASLAHLNHIHLLKTGALISGCLVGPAILKGLPADQTAALKDVGLLLGYAFQVKDDILDSEQDKNSPKNLIYHFKDAVKLTVFLDSIHKEIRSKITDLSAKLKITEEKNVFLTQFLEWNIKRDK